MSGVLLLSRQQWSQLPVLHGIRGIPSQKFKHEMALAEQGNAAVAS